MTESLPVLGTLYQHYKRGDIYIVRGFSKQESTGILVVEYSPWVGVYEEPWPKYNRPFTEFGDLVTGADGAQVLRFTPILKIQDEAQRAQWLSWQRRAFEAIRGELAREQSLLADRARAEGSLEQEWQEAERLRTDTADWQRVLDQAFPQSRVCRHRETRSVPVQAFLEAFTGYESTLGKELNASWESAKKRFLKDGIYTYGIYDAQEGCLYLTRDAAGVLIWRKVAFPTRRVAITVVATPEEALRMLLEVEFTPASRPEETGILLESEEGLVGILLYPRSHHWTRV